MNNSKRLEFHITSICNQACIFCSESDRMNIYKKYPISFLQIKIILINKRKKWVDHITFLWGEPTLYSNFSELLIFSKKLWYKVMVISNWLWFQDKDNSSILFDNIDELSLSIHWYNKKWLSFQTWNKFAYDNLLLSINNTIKYNTLNKWKINFFANIVINKYNFNDILKIIDFIYSSGYPIKQLLISYIAPEWNALNDYRNLSFDFNNLKPFINKIINKCNLYNIKINFFWIPICVLWEKNFDNSNDTYFSQRNTIERFTTNDWKITLIDVYSPDSSREREFIEKCSICKYKNNPCTGIFNKYLEYYEF